MAIADFFGDVYGILLAGNKDRHINLSRQMRTLGVKRYVRFNAITPDDPGPFKTKGMRGCTESHLAVVKEAKERQLESVLIAEDDFLLWPAWKEKWESVEPLLKSHS